ncbi:MAG: hypothetical protein CVU20_09980 [Betaproteobacteria bacterium HGW-Betaproteobacteria-14]|nr:MAG: hypothetical protein CVU20_09980 [Betaproteobacteria bacterium HGW-Betaproteobacteria-14]
MNVKALAADLGMATGEVVLDGLFNTQGVRYGLTLFALTDMDMSRCKGGYQKDQADCQGCCIH